MNENISKANDTLAFFNVRLDEVRISDHERLRAKARFAQAEAIADAVFEVIGHGKRLLKALVARPLQRLTTSAS